MSEKRKSWREIDQMRDRGAGSGKRRDDRSSLEKALENPRLREKYLKEAGKLFMGAKGGANHQRDLKAIHDAYGTPRFDGAVIHYLAQYGLPDDWATLMLLLDFKGATETVCKAIDALTVLAKGKGLIERQGLKGKLRVLSLSAKDLEVREAAEVKLSELG